jgi:signal transduction histidine kinase
MLNLIERQAEKSVKLVEALLSLARASDATLTLRDVDSGRLVAEVVQSLQQGGPPLPIVVVAAMPRVRADPELLRQVFTNLIGNAMKFSAEDRPPRIEVGVQQTAGQPVFFVQDNGMGFDADGAARLFKPFQRLHDGSHEGFGVGLSIVKRIIDRHGGRVWSEGRKDGGASFFFTIGAAAERPP